VSAVAPVAVAVRVQVRADRAKSALLAGLDVMTRALTSALFFWPMHFASRRANNIRISSRVRLRHSWQIRSPVVFPEHHAVVPEHRR
jgi:hypothetical protein